MTGILKWTLYGVYFLLAVLVQTVVLPRMPIGGVALCVVPTCVACVAVQEGADKAGLYALICGTFFCLSGIDCGPIYIVTLTVTAAIAGTVCDHFYTRSFVPALVLSFLGLILCESGAFLFRVYIGVIDPSFWQTILLPELFLSLIAFPLFYLGAWAISRIGR